MLTVQQLLPHPQSLHPRLLHPPHRKLRWSMQLHPQSRLVHRVLQLLQGTPEGLAELQR